MGGSPDRKGETGYACADHQEVARHGSGRMRAWNVTERVNTVKTRSRRIRHSLGPRLPSIIPVAIRVLKTLRYRTWRWVNNIGTLLVILLFAGIVFLPAEGLRTACEILLWTTAVVGVAFNVLVSILQSRCLLKFVYSEQDYASYRYNAERLYRQMRDQRRAKKDG
jgi:predicted ferric reductase